MNGSVFFTGVKTWLWGTALMAMSLRIMAAPLTIGYPMEVNAFHDAAAAILREAYAELGLEVRFQTFPSERSLLLSSNGLIDGELVRIAGIGSKYPGLIQVPVSHVRAEQTAFSLDPAIEIAGWESLRPHRIVFQRGYKAAELATRGMQVELVSLNSQGFAMLARGRADVMLANRFSGLQELQEMGANAIHILSPPVQVDPLYHYLNRKHRALVPKLVSVLERMREHGRLDTIGAMRSMCVRPASLAP